MLYIAPIGGGASGDKPAIEIMSTQRVINISSELYPHGYIVFYQVVATIIPLLTLNYFFNVKATETLAKVTEKWSSWAKWLAVLITHALGPIAAFAGAVTSEIACLFALYRKEATAANEFWTIAGLMALVAAGGVAWVTTFIARTPKVVEEFKRALNGQ
ncbi:hypothetical protein ACIGZJ_34650 [Kitasatospora sp. NPDC052868]|uniref:hypothetical protein n=1 Tax=Kitasatospora sp. NPDC052868 TaxID=3364060 RepID=UPI0037C8DEAB